MKLRITSKGPASSTRVVNAETGEPVEGVVSVSWRSDSGGEPVAVVVLKAAPVDVVADAEVVTQPDPDTLTHSELEDK